MGANGTGGGNTRGTRATRMKACTRRCGKSPAVTWNKRDGSFYVRPHTSSPGVWCVAPGSTLNLKDRSLLQ